MLWHTLNFSQWHIDCGCAVVSINGMLRNIGVLLLLLLLLLLLVISVLLHKSVRSDFPQKFKIIKTMKLLLSAIQNAILHVQNNNDYMCARPVKHWLI